MMKVRQKNKLSKERLLIYLLINGAKLPSGETIQPAQRVEYAIYKLIMSKRVEAQWVFDNFNDPTRYNVDLKKIKMYLTFS